MSILETLPSWNADLILNPTAVYRGAPFWSWNGLLEENRLIKQLDCFKQMGIGGVHVHSRTGLQTPYLGDDFMKLVSTVVKAAEQRQMLTWLYDEDRWPSGFGGGLVTVDPAFRCRHLLLTRQRAAPGEVRYHPVHHGRPKPVTERTFLAAWTLKFDGEMLSSWRRMGEPDTPTPEEVPLYAYTEVAPDHGWFNHQQYANLLDPRAIRRFIEVTHEAYAKSVGDRFGQSIPAIFTDEPLFRGMSRLASADDQSDQRLAWVDDFPETYFRQFGEDVFDHLPAVYFDAADGSSRRARWKLRDHHTDRFAKAFARQLGEWCESHDLALTGHMMNEAELRGQSEFVGEVMRSLRYFQLPGIDLLCDRVEYTTAKQAQSIARQCGRPGVLSELYGVTNWDFPLAGHLRQGNWQAAMGVTVRVHHLSWYSMAGEAKRDYPASIGWHMPWWQEYPAVEDHFARLAVALTTGRPICRVAMLHPIESQWVAEGPIDAHKAEQDVLESGFHNTLKWLLEGQVDADLMAESLLTELSPVRVAADLVVGEMAYSAVVLPPLLTIRSTTLERLNAFVAGGGTVVSLAPPPTLVDGRPSDVAVESSKNWVSVEFAQSALLSSLEKFRDLHLFNVTGHRPAGVVYQLREEPDGGRILFLCNVDDNVDRSDLTLSFGGQWRVETIATETGVGRFDGESWVDGKTRVSIDLPVAGHVLFRLHRTGTTKPQHVRSKFAKVSVDEGPFLITLDEPNVLLLDRAAWRLDDGEWQAEEDILRLDNRARDLARLPDRHGEMAQPWCDTHATPTHRISLRFEIDCEVSVIDARLALEDATAAKIIIDGQSIAKDPNGFYVDEDIATVAVPNLSVGRHTIEITWPFGTAMGVEACYLIGDFGVAIAGSRAKVVAARCELTVGDWTKQGLAFYGGNVTYHCRFPVDQVFSERSSREEEVLAVRLPDFAAALATVDSGGKRVGRIISQPNRLLLPPGGSGTTNCGRNGQNIITVDITLFGDRFNTFGHLHNVAANQRWSGPLAWRTSGGEWSDNYQIRPKGLLMPPILEREM